MLQVNLDLAGAEWVLVAYFSGDKNMLGVVQSGKSPHVVTGSLITEVPEDLVLRDHKLIDDKTDPNLIHELRTKELPELLKMRTRFLPRTMSIRQAGKKSNHALNYGMKYRTFALNNEVTEAEAKPICEAYSTVAYPGIQDYWKGIKQELRENGRTLENPFGRRVTLLDEWGHELWMAAFSFKPQSTCTDCTLLGIRKSYKDVRLPMRMLRLGAQVHDSLMLQLPEGMPVREMAEVILEVGNNMTPELEINGHKLRLNYDAKIGRNWGTMYGLPRSNSLDELSEGVSKALAKLS